MAKFVYGNGTNSTQGANTQLHYYDRAGINAANRKNVYTQFCDRKSMPTMTGKTYKISRWQHIYDRKLSDAEFAKKGFLTSRDIANVTTGLTNSILAEGSNGNVPVDFQKVTLETRLNRYGDFIEYTDENILFSEDYMQARYREELGELANQKYEDLIQLDMLSTTNITYSGLATSLATMGNGIVANGSLDDRYRVSYDLLRKSVAKLVRNRAKKNTTLVTGSTKIDTRTINSAYYAIIGPNVKFDLEQLTFGKNAAEKMAWVPAYQYASAATLAEGEVGAMHEIRFIESESALVYEKSGVAVPTGYVGTLKYTGTIGTDAKFDVFPILFPTEGAFATVGLKGKNKITFTSMSPDQVARDNKFQNNGFFAYNFWYAGIILQEEKLLKVLVLASDV